MKKLKAKQVARCVLIVLIIINCIVIFKFSSEQSAQSSDRSGRIVERLVEINPKTRNLKGIEKERAKENLVTPIRKTAHFSVYSNLGLLLLLCCKTFDIKDKKRILISITLAFLYACTDEIHQLFVSGRSGEFRDVCIDSCGAFTGILIGLIIWKLVIKIRNKKKS